MISDVTVSVLRLIEEITTIGPTLPEYDGLRAFDHPERIFLQLTGNTSAVTPATIDLWPSLTCNARCPLCQYRVSGARENVDRSGQLEIMSPELGNWIFKGAALCGVRSIILTGGGEPLLNPELVTIARLARLNGLSWSLNTNAFTLTPSLARALINEKPAYIKISIDAGTAESHSMIYQTPPEWFERVIDNAIEAARISDSRQIGLSFSLGSKTTDDELGNIRMVIEHILRESQDRVGFIVFRARLLHYRGLTPVVPQPAHAGFLYLADAISEFVIKPITEQEKWNARFDLKKGLFLLAGRTHASTGCTSNSWMTTMTHSGEGYATGELAGAIHSGQCWGKVRLPQEFKELWFGQKRVSLHNEIESGRIPLPIVHRTSPLDEFFNRIREITGPRIEKSLAAEIIQCVSAASWYRSRNSQFV
jgi:radical SAM family protein